MSKVAKALKVIGTSFFWSVIAAVMVIFTIILVVLADYWIYTLFESAGVIGICIVAGLLFLSLSGWVLWQIYKESRQL